MRYLGILVVAQLALGVGCEADDDDLLSAPPPRNPRRNVDAAPDAPVHPDVTDPWVNGCLRGGAEDFTGKAEVAITFGYSVGANYLPRCLRIDKGTVLYFNGPLGEDPLVGGELQGTAGFPDPKSPFGNVDRGESVRFRMDERGVYGFYSETRGATHGMAGAVWVQ